MTSTDLFGAQRPPLPGRDQRSLVDQLTGSSQTQEPQRPTLTLAESLLQETRRREDMRLHQAFSLAVKGDPNRVAEAQRLGVEFGQTASGEVEPLFIERNLEFFRGVIQERKLRADATRMSPMLRAQLADPRLARIAFDDVDNLGFFEGIAKNFETGGVSFRANILRHRKHSGAATREELMELDRLEERLLLLPKRATGLLTGTASFFGQMSEAFGEAGEEALALSVTGASMGAIASATTGPLAPVAAPVTAAGGFLLGLGVGATAGISRAFMEAGAGARFEDLKPEIDNGTMSYQTALFLANLQGFMEAGLEVTGIGFLSGVLPPPARRAMSKALAEGVDSAFVRPTIGQAAKTALKGYVMGTGAEITQEVVQDATSMLQDIGIDIAAGREIRDLDALNRFADTAVETFKMVGLLGGIAPAVRLRADVQAAQISERQHRDFARLMDVAESSALRGRSESAFEQFARRQLGDDPATEVFLEPQRVRDALEQGQIPIEEFEEAVQGITEQLRDAERTDVELAIPMATYTAKLAGTRLDSALRQDVKFEPNGKSLRDAKEVLDKAEQIVEEESEAVAEQMETNQAFAAGAKEVEDLVFAQIVATGTMNNRNARDSAEAFSAVIQAITVRLNNEGAKRGEAPRTPAEVHAENPVTIVGERPAQQPGGELFTQADLESPEFQAWFGESKVVDEQGKPLVVFKGMDTERTVIDRPSTFPAFNRGEEGIEIAGFFARNRETAERFTHAVKPAGPIQSFYLSFQNPKIIDATGMKAGDVQFFESGRGFREAVRSGEFDGVIIENTEDEGTIYVALRPEQIKSTDNRGTFDPNDPDILKQDAAPSLVRVAGLESSRELATSTPWGRIVNFKQALQERVRAAAEGAGVTLIEKDGEIERVSESAEDHLVLVGVADVLAALRENPNAVGWYSERVRQALTVMAELHPEILTDDNAKFAFVWITAVTSNGLEVTDNFRLAQKVYASFKATGEMPTNAGVGTSADAMNTSLELFNTLREDWGMELFRKVMLTRATVGMIQNGIGRDVSGENVDAPAIGAGVLGAKIGNGFFANLNGLFDMLTMDRWLVRSWGRWSGLLIYDRPDLVAAGESRLTAAISDLTPEARAQIEGLTAVEEVVDRKGKTRLRTLNLDIDLSADPGVVSGVIRKWSGKPEGRAALNEVVGGEELRRAGNSLFANMFKQKEDPANGAERNYIRRVFTRILTEVRTEERWSDLEMADLQAALWFAEKRLYDASKAEPDVAGTGNTGYIDNEAPDYANAAVTVAKENGIDDQATDQALRAGRSAARRAAASRRRSGVRGAEARVEREGGLTPSERKLRFGGFVIQRARANRADAKAASWSLRRAHRGGSRESGLLESLGVRVTAEFSPGQLLANRFKALGIGTQKVFELDPADPGSAAKFHSSISSFKKRPDTKKRRDAAAVFVHDQEAYAQMRLFLTASGRSGVAVKPDGDIVSVFSAEGNGRMMVEVAIANGGTHADAFDTVLPDIYAAHGLRVVSRTKWDESQKPRGWNKRHFKDYNGGRPDVVFMVYDPGYVGVYGAVDGVTGSFEEAVSVQQRAIREVAGAQRGQAQAFAHEGEAGPRGEFDPTDPDILKQESVSAGFYSALLSELEGVDVKATTAAGWKQTLTALTKKGAVKESELQWSGLPEWLDMQEGKVSKEAVLEFLRGNGVRVERTVLGRSAEELKDLRDEWFDLRRQQDNLTRQRQERFADPTRRRDADELTRIEASEQPLRERLAELSAILEEPSPRFSQIVLPGGTNYREILVTLPERPAQPVKFPTFEEWLEDEITQEARHDTETNRRIYEQDRLRAQQQADARAEVATFQSTHFPDHKNILVHLRVDDRVDEQVNKVLLVHEIQSDFGQAGLGKKDKKTGKRVRQFAPEGPIPRAPFVESTKGWVTLGLKQALLEAVNGNYDKVAFIDGVKAAELYSLRHQVKTISVERQEGDIRTVGILLKESGRLIKLSVQPDGVISSVDSEMLGEIAGKPLADVVGKEMAERIMAADDFVVFRDADLEVGGEGMLAFYDEIVPAALNKLSKQLGGPKVETVDIARTTKREEDMTSAEMEAELAAERADYPYPDQQPGIELTEQLRDNVAKGLPLFQDARGSFDPNNLIIALHNKADLSTFLHETAHFYLEVLGRIVSSKDAPPELQQDFQTFLDWVGVDSVQTWNGMTIDEQRAHHESFAFSFEKYLFEGRAPSKALEGLFQKFRSWLIHIYRTLLADVPEHLDRSFREKFGKDIPQLSDEVRGVFNRMLATDAEIAQMEAQRSMAPLFRTQQESGMSDAEWGRYQDAVIEAHERAVTDHNKASLRQMQWLSRARGRILKELQAQHDEQRRQVRKEAERDVGAQRVYRIQRYLRTGELVDSNGDSVGTEEEGHKLDRELTRALLPEGQNLNAVRGMTAEGGQLPDVVADLFGYESGQAMIADVAEAKPLAEAVTEETDERMLRDHGEMVDPVQRSHALEEALHNEARARFVAVELNHLQGSTRPWRLVVAAAKEAARTILARTPIQQIRPRSYASAEARAAREAQEASRAGDSLTARRAKQRQLLNHELARESAKALQGIEKTRRSMAFQGVRRSDKKLAKSRDVNMVGAARAILAAHEFPEHKGPKATAPHLERVKKFSPERYEEIRPVVEMAAANAKPWKELTLEEFRGLADSIEALWFMALREKTILIEGRRESIEGIVDKLLQSIAAQDPKERHSAFTREDDKGFRRGDWLAQVRRIESWAVQQDGGVAGQVHKYLFAMLRSKFDDYVSERLQIERSFSERLKTLNMGDGQKISAPELNGYSFENKAALLGALRHAGNESNLRKLLLGEKMVEPLEDGQELNPAPWWAFIERMIRDGKITKADLDYIQFVWDTYDSLLQRTQDAHFRVFGFFFEHIPAQPFTTSLGDYGGGYVPIRYDTRRPEIREDPVRESDPALAAIQRSTNTFRNSVEASRGFAYSRVEYNKPMLLDIRLDARHLDEHLRFLHMQPAASDVLALLRDKRLAAALARKEPNVDVVRQMFLPWIDTTVHNRVITPGTLPQGVEEFLTFLRRVSGAGIMFGNLRVALQQLTGFGLALPFVKTRYLAGSFVQLFGGGIKGKGIEKSDFMRLRVKEKMGQLRDDFDVLLENPLFSKVKDLSRHAFFLQAAFQNVVDITVWDARYEQSIAEGMSEEDAIRSADSAVRLSQGSGAAPDLSPIEKGTPLHRLILQFSNFWFTGLNVILSRQTLTGRALMIGNMMLFAGLLAGVMTKVLEGGWDDDDQDGDLWDEFWPWAVGESVNAGLAARLPFIGPALMRVATGEFGGRINPGGASFGQLEAMVRGLALVKEPFTEDGLDLSGRDVSDIFALINLVLPATQVGRSVGFAVGVERGDIEPTSDFDYYRGLLTGRASEASRR